MSHDNELDKKTIKAAEQALDIKINFIVSDDTKLKALLAAKNPPDLVRGQGGLETPYLAARDLMTDLDPYFAKSKVLTSSDLDPANDVWRFDGTKQGSGPRYGMCKDYAQDQMLWYRTDLFDAAKVDHLSETEPTSYDELLDVGKRLVKRRLGKVKVYGLSAAEMGNFVQLAGMTASAGGSLFAEDLASVDFSSPEALKALNWMIDYTKADIGPNIVNPNPDGYDWPTYQANRMAIARNGYWFGGQFAAEPKLAAVSRFVPAPQFGGKRVSPCFSGTGYWIPKNAKNKDTAWKFFEWYFAGSVAQERATTGYGIPALKSLREKMPQKTAPQKQAFKVQQQEFPYYATIPFTPYVQVTSLEAVINQTLPGLIKSGATPGKVADKLNSLMNEQISKGKRVVG
ncbi:extracellular solute-binding protein [Streptomyces scopuliridis]|uniref:extracellular solute-binding protein n=1 Tax=Streptomyces scopuliridis TaxID=452529 RepID=UPI003674DAA0